MTFPRTVAAHGATRSAPPAAPTPATPAPLGLASRQAPPFRLPGEHFAAAFIFLALGSAGLILFADQLSAGAYPSFQVIGMTHLFTVGWITTSIMGALYQFMPVALGQPIRSVRLAHVSFGLYVIGLPLFVAGLVFGRLGVMTAGGVTFGSGLIVFLANFAATLAAARRRDVTWWALLGAAVYLAVTLILGSTLAGDLRWGYLGASRFTTVGVHLHVALAGWVLLVIVGVAQRLLPMFLLSHGVSETCSRAAVALIAAGAAALVVFYHGPAVLGRWTPALLIGGGVVCFLVQASRFYRKRVRRLLDPGMRLAAIALGLLAVGLVLAAPVVAGRASPRFATAYVLVIVGGISLFVAALYYKIVPFLVWFHRFGAFAGTRPVPKVAELFSAGAAYGAAACLSLGVTGLAAGIAGGAAFVVRSAAAVFAAGVLIDGVQLLRLARWRPSCAPKSPRRAAAPWRPWSGTPFAR